MAIRQGPSGSTPQVELTTISGLLLEARTEMGYIRLKEDTMKTLDTTSTFYTKEQAEQIAAEMNATDDWTYRPVHDPKNTGYSFIEIYDEDGEFVDKL